MNWLSKLFSFLPLVLSTVSQVEQDLQGKPGPEKKQAALDSLKGAGAIAQIADGKDADAIAAATDATGKAIDAVVAIYNHTGTFDTGNSTPAPAPLTDAEKAQLASLQARANA